MCVIETKKAVPGFENEAGGHRIQRVPETERRGRVHTSTVTVSVLSDDHHSDSRYDARGEADFHYRWFSGTGAGGQHRNKHQCCLELTHLPTGLKQIANGRSRDTNQQEAMRVLLERLDRERHSADALRVNGIRSAQIGCGMRADKRRTYRFQEDSVTDHVNNRQTSCRSFMRGNIEKLW